MDFSEIMNIILSGGLVGTAAAIGSLRATVRKAKAEAMKAEADAEGVRVDNAEHATRVLVSNIVVPLKEELNATRKDLQASLRKLPEGAVYRGKSGQANLTVGSDGKGNLVAEASCDSLQQLVLWYEEELTRIRSETRNETSNDVQTVEKRPPNRMRTFITGILAGLLAGVLLTIKLKKR